MNKNSNFLFLGLTLIVLLISVGAISAIDSDNTQTLEDDNTALSTDDVSMTTKVLEKPKVSENTKKVETKKAENKNTTKTIKTNKQTKKAVDTTQTATNYETLKTSWNNIKNDGSENTDYIINVKNGNYQFDGELTITNTSNIKSITINGEDKDKTVFDAQNKSRHFNINTTTITVNFNNITFINGNNSCGGSINLNGLININNSNFIDNKAYNQTGQVYGGAILFKGEGNITNTNFINNKAFVDNQEVTYNVPSYGGAIYVSSDCNLKISLCEFNNNNSVFVTTRPNLSNTGSGGAIYCYESKTRNNITYCNFFNNHAYVGGAISFGTISLNVLKYVNFCVFNNNSNGNILVASYSQYDRLSSNYYPDGSNNGSFSEVLITGNDKRPINIVNQNTANLTLKCVGLSTIAEIPLPLLGVNYKLPVTSSSNLINTTGLYLSADNNYTTTIDLSSLPANHENITLSVDGNEVSKIVWDYTNVKFNNITAKPGDNILLNATFKTSDNKLIPNGKVAFKINGKTIGHSTIKFGSAYFNYTIPKDYTAKDYQLTVVYGGNNKFIKAQQNTKLTLNKLTTKTDIKTEIVNNTLKINIKPIDENNNTINRGKVCVKINGKTQQTFNITGVATYNFTLTKSWNNREMKILVIYGENSKYSSSRSEITTKITLPTTKAVKKEETINNYYVSAENGLDTNTGAVDSPFKTIQKAITTAQNNKQTANIYLDGNFKGIGNTNLTVPGDLRINFIGVGNSSIDGEVNYTYNTDNGYYFGSSKIWEPFRNGTGNWAMNITKGEGLITITNFTIKNCWNPGGSSISAYKTATVDNYGNLEVNNVSFIFNHGGVGASIRNNDGATLKVVDSLFEGNRKSESTGNYGPGIYNNATAVIINSTFQNNYARWGTVTNDKNMTIINSTIRDNIGYDGGSTFKTGNGITINTGGTDYFNQGEIGGIVTIIDGCIFINNDQLDISADEGLLNITNCVFNKSTGIVVPSANEQNIKYNIINNTFTSSIGSSLYNSLASTNKVIFALRLQGKYNYTIENNKVLNMAGSDSKALELTANHALVKNNTFERIIQINGNNTQIIGNNITTTKDKYTINLTADSRYNNISRNYLITNGLRGNTAIDYISTTNIISDNLPETLLITVDEESFYKYFDDDGNLLPTFNKTQQIQIIGNLTNKNMNINTEINIFQTNKNINSINITITINNANATINDLIIENTNYEPVIILNTQNNNITRLNVITNGENTIVANSENNTITNNNLIADILVGDESVKTQTGKTNTIESNTPTYKNYIL
ncbi:Ig-like domain-containing protein [Methanosphaera cuniculi]|uniref:Ig-like domain-containing protein n=1 Tax=Methanosphaera cuniculi TaxID=1077256 RepID=UPI0026DB3380|nr:Ig-like domain-containing protein [Methanosphaera cuniculi]